MIHMKHVFCVSNFGNQSINSDIQYMFIIVFQFSNAICILFFHKVNFSPPFKTFFFIIKMFL